MAVGAVVTVCKVLLGVVVTVCELVPGDGVPGVVVTVVVPVGATVV
ncbi:MAG: hypothetical protein ABSE20_14220 [Acetobacteraceae bacterium]